MFELPDTIKLLDENWKLIGEIEPNYAISLIAEGRAVEAYSERKYGRTLAQRFIGLRMKPQAEPIYPSKSSTTACSLLKGTMQANVGEVKEGESWREKAAQRKVAFWPFASENNKSITVVPRLCLS